MTDIKAGDVVRLKSGGPKMVVVRVFQNTEQHYIEPKCVGGAVVPGRFEQRKDGVDRADVVYWIPDDGKNGGPMEDNTYLCALVRVPTRKPAKVRR